MDFYFCKGGDLLVFGPSGNCIQNPYGHPLRAIANFYRQDKVLVRFDSYRDALKFCVSPAYLELGLRDALRKTYADQIAYFMANVIPGILESGETVENYSTHDDRWSIPVGYDDRHGIRNFDGSVASTIELLKLVSNLIFSDTKNFGMDIEKDDDDDDSIWSKSDFLEQFASLDEPTKISLIGYAYSKNSMQVEA